MNETNNESVKFSTVKTRLRDMRIIKNQITSLIVCPILLYLLVADPVIETPLLQPKQYVAVCDRL